MSQLWSKQGAVDPRLLEFTVGNDFELDARLVAYDVKASKAHVRMLVGCGHLSPEESASLCAALDDIGADHAEGQWTIQPEDEDCHTALEHRLQERLGTTGEKVHLGRSRNDQVLVALRLYLLDECANLAQKSLRVAEALDELGARHVGMEIPGYTHMQPAMPSSVELWAGGFAGEIRSSIEALGTARVLLDKNPLGSAAGYGTGSLKMDRSATTRELGFAQSHEPVTAVQLSRGKAEAALAFAIVLLLQDLGRLSSELCLFGTREFSLTRLAPSFTTGSSIMPQKQNPDVFELVRAHSAQAIGELNSILLVTTKLPSGYHRDLQLIKSPLFKLIDTAKSCFEIMALAVGAIEFDGNRASELLTPELLAAERAFQLVGETGISFREAYRQVATELNP